ncbi:hypothetical protein AMTR_s00055p00162350 [Amborella trichopoda]|uniref:Cystatin domain-containing protein n=1 Tax=Amborella trichopoda TaxID=13333 RepID=U5CY66_AMBTC|nr:hypothetical protein AMTR_s00055p00162350 [Amborella trichopoda]
MALDTSAKNGGYSEAQPNRTYVQYLCEFAVSIYNNRNGLNISFISVVEAQMQWVTGINYKMALQALEDQFTMVDVKKLTLFEPVLA